MSLSKDGARDILAENGLRITAPRLAVLQVLGASERPLSHTEVVKMLGDIDCDPATVFRNLLKLKDAGIAPVVSRVDGIDRYALSDGHENAHQHPHFTCNDCGQMTCLPIDITNTGILPEPWAKAVQAAQIQFQGQCPDCL